MKHLTLVPFALALLAPAGAHAHIANSSQCMRYEHGMNQMCMNNVRAHNQEHRVLGSMDHTQTTQKPGESGPNPFGGLGAFSGMGDVLNGIMPLQ